MLESTREHALTLLIVSACAFALAGMVYRIIKERAARRNAKAEEQAS